MNDYLHTGRRALERWRTQVGLNSHDTIPQVENPPEAAPDNGAASSGRGGDHEAQHQSAQGTKRIFAEDIPATVDSTDAEPPEPGPAELTRASAVLGAVGVRLMQFPEGPAIGLWSDLDGPEIRAALRVMGCGGVPIRYLDGAHIPSRYKERRVTGEPVPWSVLTAMERNPVESWKIRDRMLNEMGWHSKKRTSGTGRGGD